MRLPPVKPPAVMDSRWARAASDHAARTLTTGVVPPYFLLPIALPACVWLIRTLAPGAKGHGTEAVIAAVHQRSGRIDWIIAPMKLAATVLTLAFGGSVGKEGPAAQIGAALTSRSADVLRLNDEDRRRLVICGISAGFAAVFGTPVSGALFGLEVLYLGRLDYSVIFPALVGGIALVVLDRTAGVQYAGLGTTTIDGVLTGAIRIAGIAFLFKILATAITLETGGRGGILTPVFFVGATSGAALAHLFGLPQGLLAAFGMVSVLAAAANTPLAAAVMAIELLPAPVSVYAALSAATAFLMVGHRSVYASQKLGFSKSGGLELTLGGAMGDVTRADLRIRKGSLTERLQQLGDALTAPDSDSGNHLPRP